MAVCALCLCSSGRATSSVPSLSNSRRSRGSQDLGVKVTRKKSYNVSTFQGAGPPPPPIHYLLRRPCADQSARTERLVGRAPWPMGAAAALPHVAVRPAPSSCPRCPDNQWECGGGGAGTASGPPPRPRPRPFIRPRVRNKGRAGPRGAGSGPGLGFLPDWSPREPPGRGEGARTIVPGAGRGRKSWGRPTASVREAAASGSGSVNRAPRGRVPRASGPPGPTNSLSCPFPGGCGDLGRARGPGQGLSPR